MNLDVDKAEKALEYVKGAKDILQIECNEMMDIIQFEEYNPNLGKLKSR